LTSGLIFDIKRYAINDGPGIRVVVFFKGCNLHCAWCHNPEGMAAVPEKMFTPSKCISCGTCVSACPEEAITLTAHGIVTNTDLCRSCGICAEVCPTMAIEMSGREMTVPEIMDVIEKERIFFEQSGGGVTFSGGEPMIQSKVLIELLDECGKRGIHRAVDTAGHVNTDVLLEVAQRTDLFLYDLKVMDPELHAKWTGLTNDKILTNLRAVARTGVPVIIRIPLVGGVNDHEDNIRQTAEFLYSIPMKGAEVHLLPYHAIARHKYEKLSRPEEFELMEEPGPGRLEEVVALFRGYGMKVQVGG
jgi:pyruvate formate lyase activating enzyme